MNTKKILLRALTLVLAGGALVASAQTTVYEQSRLSTGVNPDFTFSGFKGTTNSANKSTAPGIPAIGSPGSLIPNTSLPGAPGTNFVVSPNFTTPGQLVAGTTYAVAITFGNTGNNESSDLVVATSDTGTAGNDSFAGSSSCFQAANGYNTWITVGYVTISGSLPTFTFAWQGGTHPRWYVDTIRFTPLPPPPPGTYEYWNTGSPGGSGAWNATALNWNTTSTGSGTQQAYVQADLANFNGAAGAVTVDPVNGITTDGGLEFDTTGYVVTGGTLTLGSSPSTSGTNIAVLPGATASINSVITGAYGLCSAYLGTVVLGAPNTLTGTVTLSSGTLALGTNQSFPSLAGSGALYLSNYTLTVGSDNTSTAATGVISDGGASSPGALIKTGTGKLTLGGNSTYAGTTTINTGTIGISADANLGTAPASLVANQLTLNGGRLDFTAVTTLAADRGITLGGSGGALSSPGTGTTPVIAGPISGSGSLTVPSGSIDLKASNSFNGGLYMTATPVDSGGNNLCAVRFDAQGASGAGKIFISPTTAVNCTVRNFNATTNVIVPNALELDLWTNAQVNTQIYLAGGASGTNVFPITFSGNINGAASANIGLDTTGGSSNPGGTVNLSGSNTLWTGGATLQAGTLGVGSSNALGTGGLFLVPQGPAGVLLATTPLTGASALTNSIGINTSVSSLTFGGVNNLELSGPVFLYASSTLNVTNTGSTILSGGIQDSTPFSGDSLTIAGTSTLTLRGTSSYDGGTFVNSGATLDANTAGSLLGNVTVNGGTLQLDSPNAMLPTDTLTVSSGTVNLNFTGYQTNAVLNIGGNQPFGIYGASTNNPNGVFTGTGFLVVSPAFAITSQSFDTNNNLVVCWQSTIGYSYDVLTNINLSAAGAWLPVNGSPITATNTTTCYTLPGGKASSKVFVLIRADNVIP